MPQHGVGELPTSHSRARAVWGGCVGFTAPTLHPLPMGCPSATVQQSQALTPMSILICAFQVQGWHQNRKVVTFIPEILNCLAFFINFSSTPSWPKLFAKFSLKHFAALVLPSEIIDQVLGEKKHSCLASVTGCFQQCTLSLGLASLFIPGKAAQMHLHVIFTKG